MNDEDATLLILQALVEDLRTNSETAASIDDIVRVTGLDTETVERIGIAMCARQHLSSVPGLFGWISPKGRAYYENEMRDRLHLPIIGKRLLYYVLDSQHTPETGQTFEWIQKALNIDHSTYRSACKTLAVREMIESDYYDYQIIRLTRMGRQMTLDGFRRMIGGSQDIHDTNQNVTGTIMYGGVVGVNSGSMDYALNQLKQEIGQIDPGDAALLSELVSSLEQRIAHRLPIDVGTLRQYADVIGRNSSIADGVASVLLGIAMGGQ